MSPRRQLVAAAMVLLTAACGSGSDSPTARRATDPTSAPTATEASYDGPTIAPGVYAKTFTRRDVEKLGLIGLYDGTFSPDGTSMVVYKFEDGFWSESAGSDEDSLEVGSQGSHDYDEDGNLVLDEPCCGLTVLTWSVTDGALTMKAIGPEGALADPMTVLMRDGTYTRQE